MRWLDASNPCCRERPIESSRPGERLAQDTVFVGHFKGVGRVFVQAVVDTFGSYAFGMLHTSKRPETAVAVLHTDGLPPYSDWSIPVTALLTDNGRAFCGTDAPGYALSLARNALEHRRTTVQHPQTTGVVERFRRPVREDVCAVTLREHVDEAAEPLQEALDAWLGSYNTQRPHRGDRTRGRRPLDTVQQYLSTVR